MPNTPRRLILITFLIAVVTVSLIAGYVYYLRANRVQLRIFAASSLTNLFKEYEMGFEKEHNVEIILNAASSNNLREQVVDGQICDVFASASMADMALLEHEGLMFRTDQEHLRITISQSPRPLITRQNCKDLRI